MGKYYGEINKHPDKKFLQKKINKFIFVLCRLLSILFVLFQILQSYLFGYKEIFG